MVPETQYRKKYYIVFTKLVSIRGGEKKKLVLHLWLSQWNH